MTEDSHSRSSFDRRSFLAATGSTLAVASLAGGLAQRATASPQSSRTDSWAPVPPVKLSDLSPDDFADDELTLPYYLAHLHTVANSVVEYGPHRGYIDIHVWRGIDEQHPEHLRIMENVLSLAYFYTTDRPWNVYHHSEPLRDRLEAALTFCARSRDHNGMYPWDGGTDFDAPYPSLTYANTAFMSKFLGEALVLLRDEHTIDRALYEDVLAGHRSGLDYLLTERHWFDFVIQYSNQYTNVWAGALSYLNIEADPAFDQLLQQRMEDGAQRFQSPVGFFYEGYGVDWRYSLNTHLSNVRMARHYANELSTPSKSQYLNLLNEELEKWSDFLSFNALHEPDDGFIVNRAIETRQELHYIDRVPEPGAEDVVLARAFAPTLSEIEASHERLRDDLLQSWPEVDPLPVGEFNAYSPYEFLHRTHLRWYPTDAERDEAVAALPYFTSSNFNHQRMDTREPSIFTYARRPSYYGAFNAGKVLRPEQRFGLGLLWNDDLGTVIQNQRGQGEEGVWGTRSSEGIWEETGLSPNFYVNNEVVEPAPGFSNDLPEGPVRIEYSLGSHGLKRVSFREHDISVNVSRADPAYTYEDIPIVYYEDTDELDVTPRYVTLRRDGTMFVIRFAGASSVELLTSSTHIWDDPPVPSQPVPFEAVDRKSGDSSIGNKKLATLRFTVSGYYDYRMSFA